MSEIAFIETVVRAFIPLFAIMDPFISVPVFLSLTRKETSDKKNLIALEAVGIAALLLFVFLIFGQGLLAVLGITLGAMQAAGGVLLGIMGIELVLGISFPREKEKTRRVPPAALIIGTPLITGPGVITTSILLASEYGQVATGVAAFLALLATWIVLRLSPVITKLVGETGSELLSRIMGLLLVAVAVQFASTGLRALFFQ
ncbi:MarC family protein [Candidatus Micrarchaeota archaeon]|nr:MarC family protein [Candidatus Micrarchaeota archaeon]